MIKSPDELKPVLLEKQQSLRAKLATLTTTAHNGAGYTNHQADDGTEAFDQARNLAIRKRSERTLRLVEDSLVKMEQGTYGICENCGQEIDLARLEAIPYTPLCMHCAESRDYRQS